MTIILLKLLLEMIILNFTLCTEYSYIIIQTTVLTRISPQFFNVQFILKDLFQFKWGFK